MFNNDFDILIMIITDAVACAAYMQYNFLRVCVTNKALDIKLDMYD